MFEHTPRRDQNSMDELSVLVSGHPDNRVYDRQFKARTPLHDAHGVMTDAGKAVDARQRK